MKEEKNFGCVQVTELEQGWLGKVTVVNQTSLRIKHVRLGGGGNFAVPKFAQKWIYDIRGYIDRGKFVVNLACLCGPHLLVSNFFKSIVLNILQK